MPAKFVVFCSFESVNELLLVNMNYLIWFIANYYFNRISHLKRIFCNVLTKCFQMKIKHAVSFAVLRQL